MIKRTFLSIFLILITFIMSGCAAKAFEEELNVVFMYEDEFISYDTVTQFKNIKSPELSEAYIPDGYKFFGWTPYNPNSVKATDEDFSDKYVGAGKMVHWADVEEHAENSTVILRALMIDKEEIPKVYHYVVISWYNKPATSGLDETIMGKFEDALMAHLKNQGVSEADLATVVVRGYTGNVGTSCGQIMEDDDVDIMLGWGSKDNVTSTGGMKPEMILETITGYAVGTHARTLHRLTDTETTKLVFEWLQSEECRSLFQ